MGRFSQLSYAVVAAGLSGFGLALIDVSLLAPFRGVLVGLPVAIALVVSGVDFGLVVLGGLLAGYLASGMAPWVIIGAMLLTVCFLKIGRWFSDELPSVLARGAILLAVELWLMSVASTGSLWSSSLLINLTIELGVLVGIIWLLTSRHD